MNAFLTACGARGPLRFRVEGDGETGPVDFSTEWPFVVIGQDPAADLRLAGKDVDGRHAYLQLVGGRLFGVDLASRAGTSWEGFRQRAGWIGPDHPVHIGPYRIQFLAGDEEATDPTPPAPGDADMPRLTLEILLRGVRPLQAEVGEGLTLLGTAADCQVRLLDPGLANYHCSLITTPAGVWVVDLLGPEGVRVNGERVRCARLGDGDEFQVGRTTVRLRFEPSGSEPGETGDELPGDEPPSQTEVCDVPPPPEDEDDPTESWAPPTAGPVENGPFTLPAQQSPPPWSKDEPSGPGPDDWSWEPEPEESGPDGRGGPEGSYAGFSPEPDEMNERRASYRYRVPDARARLSWWERPTEGASSSPGLDSETKTALMARGPAFRNGAAARRENGESRRPVAASPEALVSHSSPVALIDVSQTGLAVSGEVSPPPGRRVWFRLEGRLLSEWVEVIPVGSSPAHHGERTLRFTFRDQCPYELFKTLLFEAARKR